MLSCFQQSLRWLWPLVFSIPLLVAVSYVTAQSVDTDSSVPDQGESPQLSDMNNRRLGELLKKHFPNEKIVGQPGLWRIKLPAEEPVGDDDRPSLDESPTPNNDSDYKQPGKPADEAVDPSAPDHIENPGMGERLEPTLLVMTDERADRMRIMIPIRLFNPERVEDLQLALIALHANYDRALDARYAVQDGVLWSAFIHPLSSLTPKDLASALRQVQALRKNTGTSYSSGELIFGPAAGEEENDGKELPKPKDPNDQTV